MLKNPQSRKEENYRTLLLKVILFNAACLDVMASKLAQSVWRHTMGWEARESKPGGVRFSVPSRTVPWPTQPQVQWVPGPSRG